MYYLDFGSIEKAVDEMKRVLKPNGKSLLVVRSNEDYRFNKNYEIEGKRTLLLYRKMMKQNVRIVRMEC